MSEVRFIRKRGRIIPIKTKKKHKVDYKAAAMGLGGVTLSIGGAGKISRLFKNKKLQLASLLGTVFVGEAIAAEGIDRFTESLGKSKRTEQNIKNVAGGTIGVAGALSVIKPSFKKIKKIKGLLL
jgi:hypothetical protein